MIASVDLGMAVQAVREHRAGCLVVKARKITVALQAVLLRRVLFEHSTIAAAVGCVAHHAATNARRLVGEHERAAVLLVAALA